MVDLVGRRVVVVGMGVSGIAAAALCLRRGARVTAADVKPLSEWSAVARALGEQGATLLAGGHAEAQLGDADLIVVSPGVPAFAALGDAEARGVRIVGEVELATQALAHPAPVVAIGGTNGKSTTTSLVGAVLAATGRRVFVGGNLGEPLAAHADDTFDVVVLEVSSFQLERVDAFHPHVSVLLNITPDHLDRYPSFEAYAAAKGNAFVRQSADDLAVIPEGDETCAQQARRGAARIVTFGPSGDVAVEPDRIVDRRGGARYVRAHLALQGEHNALNAAAAIAAVSAFEVPRDVVTRELARFSGLSHRTALVAEVGDVRYYDDSKGTNVGAAVAALSGLAEPRAVLIAGGRDKGGSYDPLVEALRRKGRAVVLIGEAAAAIASAIGDAVPCRRARSMDEAVRTSAMLARPGDAVLLSPACASFDMFRDYKQRGDEFARAVRALAHEAVP